MGRLRIALAHPVGAALAATALALPGGAVMALLWTASADPVPVDYTLFGPAGALLLTGRIGAVFGDPLIQAGPFELAPFGVMHLLGVRGSLAWTVALMTCSAVTTFLAAVALRPVLRRDLRSSVLAGAGAVLLGLLGPTTASWNLGHPAEVLIPIAWLAAGRLALADRPVLAAAVIALSTGFEVWGLLGAPLVLLAPDVRRLRSAGAGAALLAALWLPFVLAGPFRMFSYAWEVRAGSVLHALDPTAATFPWSLRLLQSLLALGAGAAVALLLRRRHARWGVWLVPVAVVAGRLLLDPVLAGYYWDPVLVCGVGALVLAVHERHLVAAAGAALILLLASDIAPPVPRAAVLLVAVPAVALVTRGRGLPRPALRTRTSPARAGG